MWISEDFYYKLLESIKQMSRLNFNFNEDELLNYEGKKYTQLTSALISLKNNAKIRFNKELDLIDEIINGTYDFLDDRYFKDKNFTDRYNELIKHLNNISENVSIMQQTISDQGKINARIKSKGLKGEWFKIISNMNLSLESLSTPISEITTVINDVAMGNLRTKMRLEIDDYKISGDFLQLAITINTMVDQLAQFASEVTRIAKEVGTDGILGGQAEVKGVSGTWLDLTNNVNSMAHSLTAQVRNIADVTTAVAKGDLSQRITINAKGEVLSLKGTINTMVDQLAQFASEVTRIAKEVGTDGILGGQAEVKGVSGTWLDLTNNVNNMADSLTMQVRSILEVAKAVAKGNLTKVIDIDVNGEFLDLKHNINAMIHVLADSDTQNKNQNWIKDGVSSVNKEVLNKETLSEQIQTAISKLSRYVNAGMGALYIYKPIEKVLKLEGSYAYNKNYPETFTLGSGIIGQVALEKKPIHLKNIADNKKIRTATTEFHALNTYVSPLVFKDELIGVVELASYEEFDDTKLEYLESALYMLSGSLYGSLQSLATKNLLLKSQAQTNELEEQSLKLKHQNDELEIQKNTLNKQREELESANRYKSEFLANMSHELRTPLNSMLLLSNSLSSVKSIELDKLHKQASTIHDAGNSLLTLINDILDLSKIEAKLMPVNIEEVFIKPLSDELHRLFLPLMEKKRINFIVTINKNVQKSCHTDGVKLAQILKNFISNAIKFTDDFGKIELKIEQNQDLDKDIRPIRFSIIDNGIGISEDKLGIIFEAFRQADGSTSRKYGGTGLGLSISKELSNLLGGRIFVHSKINEGSTFGLCMPYALDTDNIEKELIEKLDNEINSQVKYESHEVKETKKGIVKEVIKAKDIKMDLTPKIDPNKTLILIVEDDEVFANIIADEVRKLGHQVIIANDGNNAIDKAREYKPTAIILDLMLPLLNGEKVLRILKNDFDTRHIPVEVISASNATSNAKMLGAIDFVKKPVTKEGIENIVSNLIDFSKQKSKKILILQQDDEKLTKLLEDENISTITSDILHEAVKIALREDINCVIFDTELENFTIFDFLENLPSYFNKPLIVYIKRNFSDQDISNLKKQIGKHIIKTVPDKLKLLDDVTIFLHSIKENLNEQKQIFLNDAITKGADLGSKKVLLVDDDIRNTFALGAVLEKENIRILSAQNGKEALEILQKEHQSIDMVLMDIMMPIMDGYEAIKKIREYEHLRDLPIIAVTAKVQKEDKQKCLDMGANDYLPKPIDCDRLLYLLKVWTKKG